MSLELLKTNLKKGILHRAYLFYGPEHYLKNHYLKKLQSMVVNPDFQSFNLTILEGKDCSGSIIDSCETLPVMGESKLVIVKESGLFGNAGKSAAKDSTGAKIQDIINQYLSKLPEYIYIVFVETDISKKSKLFNKVRDIGACVEFGYQEEGLLIKWVIKLLDSYKVKIDKPDVRYLLTICGLDMTTISNEAMKLADLVRMNGTVEKIHIDSVCTKTLQGRVFEMIDAVTQKGSARAYQLLNDMLSLREPVQKISVLIARHFRLLFYVKGMEVKGYSAEKMARYIGVQPFIVSKYVKQSRKYSQAQLREAVRECMEMDCRLKSGRIDPRIAIETFIGKYAPDQ